MSRARKWAVGVLLLAAVLLGLYSWVFFDEAAHHAEFGADIARIDRDVLGQAAGLSTQVRWESQASGDRAVATGLAVAAVAALGVAGLVSRTGRRSEPHPADGGDGRMRRLAELADLRDRGALTDEEFAEQKRRLLDR